MGTEVTDKTYSAPIIAFKQLCIELGDYKLKEDDEGTEGRSGLGHG